jgi:hypothetical protein
MRGLGSAGSKKNLALGVALIVIAKLGGYQNRKCDGPPGMQSLGTGFARFYDMVLYHRALARGRPQSIKKSNINVPD